MMTLPDGDYRLRHVLEQARVGIALEDLDGRLLLVNPALCSVLGYTSAELTGMSCVEFGHAADSEDESVLFEKLRSGLIESYTIEKRYVRKDGAEIWGHLNVSRLRSPDGDPPLLIAMLEDVTERKAADEELKQAQAQSRELTERLIHAQDDERSRIGRELHDDFAQRVALLAMELRALTQTLADGPNREQYRLASTLCGRVDELAVDLHDLSHTLSPSQLQHLGLGAALKDLSDRLSRQFRIELDVCCDIPTIPADVALCLFRVAQEALHNVARHSQARQAFVDVRIDAGELRQTVRDTGVGFDPSGTTTGIGIASMRERLRILGGRLTIDSSPGRGSSIVATLPVELHG